MNVFVIALVGVLSVVTGVLLMIMSYIPGYYSRSEGRAVFMFGLVLFIAGIAGVLYAVALP